MGFFLPKKRSEHVCPRCKQPFTLRNLHDECYSPQGQERQPGTILEQMALARRGDV